MCCRLFSSEGDDGISSVQHILCIQSVECSLDKATNSFGTRWNARLLRAPIVDPRDFRDGHHDRNALIFLLFGHIDWLRKLCHLHNCH